MLPDQRGRHSVVAVLLPESSGRETFGAFRPLKKKSECEKDGVRSGLRAMDVFRVAFLSHSVLALLEGSYTFDCQPSVDNAVSNDWAQPKSVGSRVPITSLPVKPMVEAT